jgi:small subunit ribosomal protein S17
MAEATTQEEARTLRQEKVGKVVSAKMAKTIVVEVTRRVPHPLYRREVQLRKKFYAHDEQSQCKVGDVVRIVESRPLSRLKRWRLAEVIRRAKETGPVKPADVPVGAPPAPQTGTEG